MREVGDDAHELEPGKKIALDSRVTVTCVAASGAVLGTSPMLSSDENELSVSLLLEFSGFKALFGGDSHTAVEQRIATVSQVQGVDLYKSNHHGSDTSSDAALMTALKPSLIVISNGSNRGYHHPRGSTVLAYTKLPVPPIVLQTNRCKAGEPCGNVASAFIADSEMRGKDGTILITVDAVTRTFTAAYGVSTVRTFHLRVAWLQGWPFLHHPRWSFAGLLPNPVGDDEQLEEVSLRNPGTAAISLAGWTLQDRSGLVWTLSGSLAVGQSVTFKRQAQPLSLNNAGDEILLIDDSVGERDRFVYLASEEGKRILTNWLEAKNTIDRYLCSAEKLYPAKTAGLAKVL